MLLLNLLSLFRGFQEPRSQPPRGQEPRKKFKGISAKERIQIRKKYKRSPIIRRPFDLSFCLYSFFEPCFVFLVFLVFFIWILASWLLGSFPRLPIFTTCVVSLVLYLLFPTGLIVLIFRKWQLPSRTGGLMVRLYGLIQHIIHCWVTGDYLLLISVK